jgi:hypothetical protein
MSRRLLRSVVLGLLGGIVLAQGVLARPDTARLSGAFFWWALFWRGAIYGLDGVLLFSVPWVVASRALDAEGAGIARKLTASCVAYIGILGVTTAYHLGYRDFRSSKIVQPNIGSTIAAVPTTPEREPCWIADQPRVPSRGRGNPFAGTRTCSCRRTGSKYPKQRDGRVRTGRCPSDRRLE